MISNTEKIRLILTGDLLLSKGIYSKNIKPLFEANFSPYNVCDAEALCDFLGSLIMDVGLCFEVQTNMNGIATGSYFETENKFFVKYSGIFNYSVLSFDEFKAQIIDRKI